MPEGHRLDLMDGNLVVDSAYTDASGEAVLSVPQSGSWEVQLTYNGRLHKRVYSVGGAGLSTQFVLPEATRIQLIAYDGPQNGRMIHALDGLGQEISYTRSTDSSGYTSFHLEPGMYQFRHSWNGRQHYSSLTPAGLTTTLQVPQRTLVRILENGMPLQGQVVESHFLDGTKIHYSRMTDHDGYAEFHLLWAAGSLFYWGQCLKLFL